MSTYVPRHAKHPDPASLPPILRGLADKIQVIPGSDENEEQQR